MEPKINESFKNAGKTFKCIPCNDCHQCDFNQNKEYCKKYKCSRDERTDKTPVVFKQVIKKKREAKK